jgi:hypothetical protein
MTEMVTSGSMSGERKRSDGSLGESGYERRRSHQAPPVLHATAPLLDSTVTSRNGAERRLLTAIAFGAVSQSLVGSSSPSVTVGGSQGRLLLTRGLLVRIQPEEPIFSGSIPETQVTLHSGDMGDSFGANGLSIGSSRHVSSSK